MQKPVEGGGTVRDACKTFLRETGKPHPEATSPVPCPVAVFYIYRWFMEMSRGRPIGGMGSLMTIPPSEILAWSQLTRNEIVDWELEAIGALDGMFLKVMGEK